MNNKRYYNRYHTSIHVPNNVLVSETELQENCLPYTSLAMVYAPKQCFRDLFDLSCALEHGTLFKELNLQFLGKRY